ncbi:MAG TPA: A/G-specific adenine glycosylase [Candidatus Hydrogenedentes bacterium]|nr:A/G-specific adenine glycosylase [Candidatus Hydrogenedentota bacterium]HPG67825.1 A/G-specific adenine glycosylase [Candidatus Hydrogenedentota bacterium]
MDTTGRKAPPIRRALLRWFRSQARDLPWRRTHDPYAVWISEIILQQTRIDQGLPYFERFIAAFPDVAALAHASEDAVLKRWEGLGYYSRARNLHKAAQHVVHDLGGILPRTAEAWQTLPGVGRYTAGAIASIAFGERVPVVDGNVKRVLARLFDIEGCIDDATTTNKLWDIAARLVPPSAPGDFNQAMMELGARICTPRNPACETCPACGSCDARAAGVQEARPVRRARRVAPHEEQVVAIIVRNGRYLLARRPPRGLLGGLWEFPAAAIAPGETHTAALERAARDLLAVEIRPSGLVATINHTYSHLRVTLHAYRCSLLAGRPSPRFHTETRWVALAHIDRYAIPRANHRLLAALS